MLRPYESGVSKVTGKKLKSAFLSMKDLTGPRLR